MKRWTILAILAALACVASGGAGCDRPVDVNVLAPLVSAGTMAGAVLSVPEPISEATAVQIVIVLETRARPMADALIDAAGLVDLAPQIKELLGYAIADPAQLAAARNAVDVVLSLAITCLVQYPEVACEIGNVARIARAAIDGAITGFRLKIVQATGPVGEVLP